MRADVGFLRNLSATQISSPPPKKSTVLYNSRELTVSSVQHLSIHLLLALIINQRPQSKVLHPSTTKFLIKPHKDHSTATDRCISLSLTHLNFFDVLRSQVVQRFQEVHLHIIVQIVLDVGNLLHALSHLNQGSRYGSREISIVSK